MYIPITVLHMSLILLIERNLFKHHNILSLVIISFILMILTFDQAVILLGEIIRLLELLDAGHYWGFKGYSLRYTDMYIYHGIVGQ